MFLARVLCVFLLILAIGSCRRRPRWRSQQGHPRGWKKLQKSHVPENLSGEALSSIASLSSLRQLRNEELQPLLIERVSDTEGSRQAREHIKSRLQNLGGWTIEEDEFEESTPYGRKTFVNVIATFNPAIRRRLVIACHYDSKYYTEIDFIGATDSAVPCAMMLDAARSLDDLLKSTTLDDVTIQLLFFDGEEAFVSWTDSDSLYGSRHLAAKMENNITSQFGSIPLTDLDRMDLFILLDLIGAANPVFRNNFAETDTWFKHFSKIEKNLKVDGLISQRQRVYFPPTLHNGRYSVSDDHLPYLKRGVRIIHLIAVPFPSVWHTSSDNAAALDQNTMTDINTILRVFIADYLHLRPSTDQQP